MKTFTAIVERADTSFMLVMFLEFLEHTQGETLDELQENLREVIEMLWKMKLWPETEFVGTQQVIQ